MSINVQVIFYSMYGHTFRLAEAVAAGAAEVEGAEVGLFRVAELVPDEVLVASGAAVAQEAFAHVPLASIEQLAEADAVIIGTPTRYGAMAAQMRNYWDQTGPLWAKGKLIGKVGSVFCTTATQHGGQEMTLFAGITTMLHHGMLIVGVPYSVPGISTMAEASGGSPYGATAISAPDGSRMPIENELDVARAQGRRVAEVATRLKG